MTARGLFDLDGTTDVPPGKIASVVTYLEMRRPSPVPVPDDQIQLVRLRGADADRYRAIYRRIGEAWFWFSRLGIAPDALAALLDDPGIHAFAAHVDGVDAGLLEIDFRIAGEAEIVYFGLTEAFVGRGYGRGLMNHAQAMAWSAPVERFWLHTCTLDHPGAVGFYRRSGFVPYKLGIEIADDPRLTGALPRHAFPEIPLREA
ncbi:GNAT family N-acetyltransferase [uncultured Alsobacter sp.]|uniref:GNAT family N-acetyltransferase n=1 Tax=uncultured Alsobacter sp. TaxID=1748258 RepID=UPI0025EC17A5|nr:GNAT family N-acetyltransferase [uncultured Alsobacter sp.]